MYNYDNNLTRYGMYEVVDSEKESDSQYNFII